MNKFKSYGGNYFVSILIVFSISLLTLYPSFKLSLTGDDFLGYWRYEQLVQHSQNSVLDLIKYIFTDYGPQDLLTALIHSLFGFSPIWFYISAFILRFLASLSFIPLMLIITKDKRAATLTAVFFGVATAGMEVIDWSFNMPSYLGILCMNLWIVLILKSYHNNYFKFTVIGYIFFILAIIVQPIRMLALPLFAFILHGLTLCYKYRPTINKIVIHIILSLFISFALIKTSQYGVDTSASKSISDFQTIVTQNKLTPLFNPIGIIGNILVPTSYLPNYLEKLLPKFIYLVPSLMFIIFTLVTKYLNRISKKKSITKPIFILGIVWVLISTYVYSPRVGIEILMSDYLGLIVGGFFCIMTLNIVILSKKNIFEYLLAFAMILSFIIPPWFRNPTSIFSTESRYLIISASGLAIYVGLLYSHFVKSKLVVGGLLLYLAVNIFITHKFLSQLSLYRGSHFTEKIRSSLPYVAELGYTKEPIIFYIEGGNEKILYHTLYFGFPFFMNYYKHGMSNPWSIAYTTNFDEIISAYQTGESLKRHGTIKKEPVKIENIYSVRVDNYILKNTSETTRKKLRLIDH